MVSTPPKMGNEVVCYLKPTTKAYQFVTTVEGSRLPLRLEIDCDSDRDATLIALNMGCELTTIEVWDGERLIYKVPSLNEALEIGGFSKVSAPPARHLSA